jgi:hypothetical protein
VDPDFHAPAIVRNPAENGGESMSLPFLHKFRAQSSAARTRVEELNARTAEWPLSLLGAQGPTLLQFSILGFGESAPRKPGIFIYARRGADGQWQSLFIGETSNLQNRLSFNEIAADALMSGATDIHVLLTDGDPSVRRDTCEKLIFTNRPSLNEDVRERRAKAHAAGASHQPARPARRTSFA